TRQWQTWRVQVKFTVFWGFWPPRGGQQYLRSPNSGPAFAERRATLTPPAAASSGTFQLGGDRPVHRLGFGAMRLTGKGIFGPPSDRAEAIATLRRCLDLEVNLIDTAESYGPHVSE